ncbi:MAG: hypothetical protein D6705_12660 [Deltaproteobacteria bacterium]|nr:MAG: hypothetical protein D6705_12660 [Deltaproteobacteria bacterium]
MTHRNGIAAWIVAFRWPLALFLAALAVRLHWNLAIHPPEDYVYSDMHGYVSRGLAALDRPFERHEYAAFFPYGNHLLVAAVKGLFGRDAPHALGVTYALIGSTIPPLAYGIARRASRYPWVPPLLGALLVAHYPLVSLGGYVLSEIPFAAATLAAHLGLTLVALRGRIRDAVFGGCFAAVATAIRPQILLTMALLGLVWLPFRRAFGMLRLRHLVVAFVPVALVLVLSAVRFHHHTGRFGLVSENATLNLAFGRCHAAKIESLPDGKGHGRVHFQPPSFLQMRAQERRGKQKLLDLEPALGYDLRYEGYIGDGKAHMAFVRECVRKTGVLGQLKYAVTNVVLLWRYNVPWPDSGRSQWRGVAAWWQRWSRNLYAVPALVGLVLFFRPRRRPAMTLVCVQFASLLLTSAIFFGSGRIRAPYDPFIMLLALETYSAAALLLAAATGRLVSRRSGPSRPQTKDSG